MHFFSKKVSKKFGQFEKSVYLCTRKSDNEELNGSVAQLNRASYFFQIYIWVLYANSYADAQNLFE